MTEKILEKPLTKPRDDDSLDTLPGCITYFGHPTGENGPCEKCRYAFICKRCIPKFVLDFVFKEPTKCKT